MTGKMFLFCQTGAKFLCEVLQMKNRFQQFMYGRYGMDQFNRVISFAALILLIIAVFVKNPIVEIAALALLVWCYFRMFSRNVSRRASENQKFLTFKYRMLCKFKANGRGNFAQNKARRKIRREQKKIYRFYVCPGCSQKVRVPKGKGKICITCPKCQLEFVRRT